MMPFRVQNVIAKNIWKILGMHINRCYSEILFIIQPNVLYTSKKKREWYLSADKIETPKLSNG